MADAVHPLRPPRVLPVDLAEPHDGHDTEEVDDREKHEREGNERVPELGCLRDERERDDRAGERGDEDRGSAHRLRVGEAARREKAPVLGLEDLERVRAEPGRLRAAVLLRDAGNGVGLEHD